MKMNDDASLARLNGHPELRSRVANILTAYNSILLSMLLDRYQAAGDQKALDLLKKIRQSPGNTSTFSDIMPFETTTIQLTLRRCWQA